MHYNVLLDESPFQVVNSLKKPILLQVTTSLVRSGEGATNRSAFGSGWGTRSGTEDDKEALRDIIYAELNKPENHGLFLFVFIFIDIY